MPSISYIPLLYIKPELTDNKGKAERLIEDVMGHLEEIFDSGVSVPKACLWFGNNSDTVSPVLLMDEGDAIYDHIIWWSENHPEKFFQLSYYKWEDHYTVRLTPSVDQSLSRLRYNHNIKLEESEPLNQVVYVPIEFNSQSMDAFLKIENILPRIGDEIDLGILNNNKFNHNDLNSSHKNVKWLKNIRVSEFQFSNDIKIAGKQQ